MITQPFLCKFSKTPQAEQAERSNNDTRSSKFNIIANSSVNHQEFCFAFPNVGNHIVRHDKPNG
jgi:hypothetical protein